MKIGIFICVLATVAAHAAEKDAIVQLPAVKVPATPLERYTVRVAGYPGGPLRLFFMPGPRAADMLALLVGGVQPGDEIVKINGREVSTLKRNEWSSELSGSFQLVIKRPVGRRSFRLIEVSGRHA